ncbi:MAG: MFS transporter [Anaerolineae bacterium]|nr:MFS transporter [Anaerolineae bacterium]
MRTSLLNFAQSLVFTTWMIYQAQILGLDALQLVLIGTMMEISILLFEIPTGVVADVISRRLSVIIGTLLMGVGFLVMGLASSFEMALVSQLFWGIGYTFTSGAYDAWLVDEVGQEQAGNAFMRGSQTARISGLLGIIASTLLATLRLDLPLLIGGGIHLLHGLLLMVIMPERGFTPTPKAERTTWRVYFGTFAEGLKVVRSRPALINIVGVGFFYGLFSEAWDRLWQIHLTDTIGLPAALPPQTWIGLLFALDAILGAAAVEALRRRLDTANSRQMTASLLVSTAVMVSGLVVFAIAGNLAVAIAAFFAFMIARGLVEPIFATWTNQHIDSRVRATVLSMQSQVDAIGQIAGGPPLGAIGQRSLRLSLIASAIALSPALALLARVWRRSTPRIDARPAV